MHGRNGLLATYLQFQACVPQENRCYGPVVQRPMSIPPQRKHNRSASHPEVNVDVIDAVDMMAGPGPAAAGGKLLHEEIALLWTISNTSSRDVIYSNSWFFFELMVKSMVEHLGSTHKLDVPRKQRFSERFLEDIARLVNLVTTEILLRQRVDGKDSKVLLNCYLKKKHLMNDFN